MHLPQGHQGQFVYIRDDRSTEDYFGVCEVQVIKFEGRPTMKQAIQVMFLETIPCGAPQIPLNMEMKIEGTAALYSCNPGYTLIGSRRIECKKSRWNEDIPTCKGEYINLHIFFQ